MPIDYRRDDGRKRVVVAVIGPLEVRELQPLLEQHRTGGAWTYGLLYDLRLTAGYPSRAEMREFAAGMKASPAVPARGPVAVVVSDPALYSLACSYAALMQPHAVFEVFRSLDDADAWLSKQGF